MTLARRADVVIDDLGTEYFVPTFDEDVEPENFNPTTATVKQIVFKMPAADGAYVLITRAATAAQRETLDGDSIWGLLYTVLEADIGVYVDTDNGGFHQYAGYLTLEGHVEFGSSQKWTSQPVTRDQHDRPLRIVARLAA